MKTKYRLRHAADFRAVRGERQGAGDSVLRIQVRANGLGHPRLGIVASKRLGGAVVRNRLRRRLRAQIAARLWTLGAHDLVVIPQPAALSADAASLGASLQRALQRAGVAR
ncbi:MAG: ribonuclease P protein component [Candidatus Dormibacteria bacterium]